MWSSVCEFVQSLTIHTLLWSSFCAFVQSLVQSTSYMWSSVCEFLALVTLWLHYNLVFHLSQNTINIGLQIMTGYVRHLHCCKLFELCHSNLGRQGWKLQSSPCICGARIHCVRIVVWVLEDCEERITFWAFLASLHVVWLLWSVQSQMMEDYPLTWALSFPNWNLYKSRQ